MIARKTRRPRGATLIKSPLSASRNTNRHRGRTADSPGNMNGNGCFATLGTRFTRTVTATFGEEAHHFHMGL